MEKLLDIKMADKATTCLFPPRIGLCKSPPRKISGNSYMVYLGSAHPHRTFKIDGHFFAMWGQQKQPKMVSKMTDFIATWSIWVRVSKKGKK